MSLEEREGEIKVFGKSFLNLKTTVVNKTLLGQTQANPYCLKFPKIGDSHI